jgi:hypothetical protein
MVEKQVSDRLPETCFSVSNFPPSEKMQEREYYGGVILRGMYPDRRYPR